jgi:hypothetical protein
MSNEDSTIKLTVFRVRYAIFGRNLAPIGEYSSSRRFFKIDCGKITNTASKGKDRVPIINFVVIPANIVLNYNYLSA